MSADAMMKPETQAGLIGFAMLAMAVAAILLTPR